MIHADKPIILISFLFWGVLSAQAQLPKDSAQVMQLPTAEVESARVVRTKTGFSLFPSMLQRQHAGNGLELLLQMRLPSVHIDGVEKTVTSSLGTGKVVVLLNGVEATLEDVESLPQELVARVEYVTIVPPKYGGHVAVLLDVRTRMAEHGFAVGVNAMNAFTTSYNDDGVWGKYFHKNSTWGARYKFRLNDITKAFTESEQTLRLADGTLWQRSKRGQYEGGDFRGDDVMMTYNFTLPERRVVDVKGGFAQERFPQRTLHEQVFGDTTNDLFTLTHSNEERTHLRAYYQELWSARDQLTLSLAAAYLNSNYVRGFRSVQGESLYDVSGKKYSWQGEADYQHSFSNEEKLNVGYQHSGAFTRNAYLGTANATLRFHDASQYAYVQWGANLGSLSYTLSVGGSREQFGESVQPHTFYTFRPAVSLHYPLNKRWVLYYRYERVPTLPTLSELSGYVHQDDHHIFSVGNPDLRGFNTDISTFVLGFQGKSVQTNLYAIHEYAHRRISDNEVEQRGQQWWVTTSNRLHTHHFEVGVYVAKDLWQRAVNVYVEPKFTFDKMVDVAGTYAGLQRRHHPYLSLQAGLTAYWHAWSLNAYYRSSTEQLVGPILAHEYAVADVHLGYQRGGFSVSVGWKDRLSEGRTSRVECLSSVLSAIDVSGNRGFHHMFYVSCSWTLFRGHQNKVGRVEAKDANWDSGIVK